MSLGRVAGKGLIWLKYILTNIKETNIIFEIDKNLNKMQLYYLVVLLRFFYKLTH